MHDYILIFYPVKSYSVLLRFVIDTGCIPKSKYIDTVLLIILQYYYMELEQCIIKLCKKM